MAFVSSSSFISQFQSHFVTTTTPIRVRSFTHPIKRIRTRTNIPTVRRETHNMVVLALIRSVASSISSIIFAGITHRPLITSLGLLASLEAVSSIATRLIPSLLPLELADVYSILAGNFLAYLNFKMNASPSSRSLLLLACTTIWAWRLSLFLFRRTLNGFKDSRIDNMRDSNGGAIKWCLAQTMWIFISLLPVWIGMRRPITKSNLNLLDFAGVAGFIVGLLFESIGDEQRASYISRMKKGKVKDGEKWCSKGLFRFCRFPNYFGEWLIWTSLSVIGIRNTEHWTKYFLPFTSLFLHQLFHKVSIRLAIDKMKRQLTADEYEEWEKTSLFFPSLR